MPMIADKYSGYMYDMIDRVMKEIGPRESCSDEEKRLGREFASVIAPACKRVETHEFTCSPNAFLGFFPWLVLMYLAGVVLYFFLPAVSVALVVIAFVALFFEVVRYRELLDPLFTRRTGENIAGHVAPSGTAKRRVYVSGHFDSAFEFKLWYWFKGFSTVVMGIGVLGLLLLFGFGLARTISQPVGLPSGVYWIFGWVILAFTPIMMIFVFFHTRDLVPGAMDDMAAIAVLAGLAKYFEDAKRSGDFYPKETEVVLLGLSSEEAGLRGAKRFAADHRVEPDGLPAQAIFLDGIYDEQFFTVFRKEVWPGATMDPGLVDTTLRAARIVGQDIALHVLPLGATDASAFALAGIPSVSFSLAENQKLAPNYHTRYDTIDWIRPESLAVALQTVIEMLKLIDA